MNLLLDPEKQEPPPHEIWHYASLDDVEACYKKELDSVISDFYLKDPQMHYLIMLDEHEEYLGSAAFKFEEEDAKSIAVLKDIFIHEDKRSEGLGKLLLEDFEEYAVQAPKKLAVLRENIDAIRFYQRQGYEIVADGSSMQMMKS